MVELVAWNIVTQPITRVFGEPEFPGARINVSTHAVAHAQSHNFCIACFWIHTTVLRCGNRRNANVEGRAKWHIEPAFGIKGQIFPTVRNIRRHVVIDHFGLGHFVQIGFGVVVFQNAINISHIEGAISKGNACWHFQARQNGFDDFFAAFIHHGVNRADTK